MKPLESREVCRLNGKLIGSAKNFSEASSRVTLLECHNIRRERKQIIERLLKVLSCDASFAYRMSSSQPTRY